MQVQRSAREAWLVARNCVIPQSQIDALGLSPNKYYALMGSLIAFIDHAMLGRGLMS